MQKAGVSAGVEDMALLKWYVNTLVGPIYIIEKFPYFLLMVILSPRVSVLGLLRVVIKPYIRFNRIIWIQCSSQKSTAHWTHCFFCPRTTMKGEPSLFSSHFL